MMLDFYDSHYGYDLEAWGEWPEYWPRNIEFPDGPMDSDDCGIWFRAFNTSLLETVEDIAFREQGYLFRCIVYASYATTNTYYEDVLARFPAHDKEEAERLLQVAANALYEEE